MECPYSSTAKTNINNNQQEEIGKIYLNPVNQLMITITQPHNRHPKHDLPQTCGLIKSVRPVWILSTDNFQCHPSKSFRINER